MTVERYACKVSIAKNQLILQEANSEVRKSKKNYDECSFVDKTKKILRLTINQS